MTYSKIHFELAKRLNDPNVLTDPKKFLGPNYLQVLIFWSYIDTLSEEERRKMGVSITSSQFLNNSYYALDEDVLDSAENAAWDSSEEVVGEEVANMAWNAALDVTDYSVFGEATLELIGSHKLLEQGKSPTFLPLCCKAKTHSKAHQEFSKLLEEPAALTNPQDFLGPNYPQVLIFWSYIDTLSEDECREISSQYWQLVEDQEDFWFIAQEVAEKVVGEKVTKASYDAVLRVFKERAKKNEWRSSGFHSFGYATYELIGLPKLLGQDELFLTFLPLFVKP